MKQNLQSCRTVKKSESKSTGNFKWLLIPAAALLLAFFLNFFIIINARIPSGSMEPTIPSGSWVLGLRTAYHNSSPERGDVIFFYHHEESDHLLIKRVIALPGQVFEIRSGTVYIDKEPIDEPYIEIFSSDDYGPVTIPQNSYIVLGDNRNESRDSRFWENPFVLQTDIQAKAIFTYFPKFKKMS